LVAQLWDAGHVNAAIEMESLWNSLGLQIPFSVFCAYPTRLVEDATPRNELGRVYELGGVIGRAPDAAAAPFEIAPARHFIKSKHAPRAARCFVVETLQQWGREELIDDAAIAVTELATNAVIHARSDFDVAMSLSDGGVRIAVSDGSRTLPVLHEPSLDAPSGRGVAVVAALTDRWGIELGRTPGKTVWVVLR
jgi:anti-sigma regulatory factor (Ser/Thr protein kinase)